MTEKKEIYDVVIIGGGPAGFTSSLYAKRRGLNVALITAELGGQMSKIAEIENWPGENIINGATLAIKMKNQIEKMGVKIIYEQVISFLKNKDDNFTIKTTQHDYLSRSIILAHGKTPRSLRVPGELELMGRGVSYCVNCDGPLYKGKAVAIVGGGNSALDAAVMMSGIANKVYLIHRRDKFSGENYMVKKVRSSPNVIVYLDTVVKKINGDNFVTSIDLSNGKELTVDGIFIEIGFIVNDSLVRGKLKLDEFGQVVVDAHQSTSMAGVFAAGDLTNMPFQQLIIACGEGATASLSAFDYIQKTF